MQVRDMGTKTGQLALATPLARVRLSPGRRALLEELDKLGRKAKLDELAAAGTGPNRAVSLLHAMRKQGLVRMVETDGSDGTHHVSIKGIEITPLGRAALARAGVDVSKEQDVPTAKADDRLVLGVAADMQAERDAREIGLAVNEFIDAIEAAAARGASDDASDTGHVAQDDDAPATPDASPQQGDDDDMAAALAVANPWASMPSYTPAQLPDPWLGELPPDTQAALQGWADARAGLVDNPENWPVLTALRQRRARQDRLRQLLHEAADLADDTGLGVTLLEQADRLPGLDDVALEYLRYADARQQRPQRPADD